MKHIFALFLLIICVVNIVTINLKAHAKQQNNIPSKFKNELELTLSKKSPAFDAIENMICILLTIASAIGIVALYYADISDTVFNLFSNLLGG